jgi:pantoate--beta-alanine ligase
MTRIVRQVADMRKQVGAWKADGKTVAVVPTMGALHEGHLVLVREAFKHADRVITTIFVNPKQFAAHEDLGKYPRTEEQDVALLQKENVQLVFAPAADAMYAPGFATTIHMEGPAKAGLEDYYRPQFFDGVATVVTKLFLQTQADVAMFGEKDYQQLLVVKQLAADLNIPINVIGVPTVRDPDGMAMSSRNRYLSAEERKNATAIHRALSSAAEQIRTNTDRERATQAAEQTLTQQGFRVDYVTCRNAITLAKPKSSDEPLRLLAAAWLGKTRLIDNIAVC